MRTGTRVCQGPACRSRGRGCDHSCRAGPGPSPDSAARRSRRTLEEEVEGPWGNALGRCRECPRTEPGCSRPRPSGLASESARVSSQSSRPRPVTQRVPASGTPVISDASSVRARRSSGSRSWTSRLPQARARIWISERHRRATSWRRARRPRRSSSRFISSGSCVVMPTGQRPVWQWWQCVGRGADGVVVLDVERLVAVEGDQRGGADVDGVGAQGHRLGRVAAVADAAGDDQLHLAVAGPAPPAPRGPRTPRPGSGCRCAPAAGRARRRCRPPCRRPRPRRPRPWPPA